MTDEMTLKASGTHLMVFGNQVCWSLEVPQVNTSSRSGDEDGSTKKGQVINIRLVRVTGDERVVVCV